MEYKELKDEFEKRDFVNNWMRGEYGFNDDNHCIDMGEVEECLESFRDYMVKLFESVLKKQETKIRRKYEKRINKEYVHVAKIDWSMFPPILNEKDGK